MKSAYLLGVLAYGLRVRAAHIPGPAADVVARQFDWGNGDDWPWGGGGGGGSGGGSSACEWEDHCLGDPCETENDCDGDLICRSGRCANPGGAQPTSSRRPTGRPTPTPTRRPTTSARPTPPRPTSVIRTTTVFVTVRPTPTPTRPAPDPTCEWTGHCAGDPCETEIDCDGQLICIAGACGAAPGGGAPVPSTTRRPSVPFPTRQPTSRPASTRTTARPPTSSQRPSCGDSPLACLGVSCRTNADCGFELIVCRDGVCSL
ncbi:hypothetical protein N656DRAFT_782011 [Canariomyces notabilis]|uniref:Uncharacterized protein n=1 Tax=Canariomyces notabilis TaxID=2074819 RepID=A0AAN6QHK1_9PEZI|nr:hypothetical protein N656DRAFT_782011 [Canariomyces arenarius]